VNMSGVHRQCSLQRSYLDDSGVDVLGLCIVEDRGTNSTLLEAANSGQDRTSLYVVLFCQVLKFQAKVASISDSLSDYSQCTIPNPDFAPLMLTQTHLARGILAVAQEAPRSTHHAEHYFSCRNQSTYRS
jgi:hypothetical protein